MRACALGGAPREANELLNRMKMKETRQRGKTSGKHLSPPSPNVDSYNIAISAFAIAGWWERALELIAELRSPHSDLKPNVTSYNHMFLALHSAPLQKRSFIARRMLKSMQSDGIEPDMVRSHYHCPLNNKSQFHIQQCFTLTLVSFFFLFF